MKEIPLSQGKTVKVDDCMYDLLNTYNWCAVNAKYAVRRVYENKKLTNLYMHKFLVKAPEGFTVVFKDQDSLNCQISNLCIMPDKEAKRYSRQKNRRPKCSL